MENKILAVVKFNDGEALVLEKEPELIYTKYDSHTIVGTDGLFHVCYGYERPDERWKAFGGRKFELPLSDGTTEFCNGQWWASMTSRAVKELGITEDNKAVSVTACSIDNLKRCYVFHGYTSTKQAYLDFRKTYDGPVYEYREYEKLIKNQ